DELMHLAPQVALRTCVELGHAMGNQHWPALVKGDLVYVPLTVDRRVMASVMETHRFEGIRYEFVSGRAVVPYLAPHESRRLRRGGRSGALAHARELYRHRHGDGTGIRTPASALPSASGDRYSCTWIAAQSRFHARAGGMIASKRQVAPHYLRGCCSLAIRCSPSAGFHFLLVWSPPSRKALLPMQSHCVRSRAPQWSRQRVVMGSR